MASVASVRQHRQHRAAGSPMGLFDHLAELRRRLLVAVVAVAVGGIAVFVIFDHLLGFLLMPYCHAVGPGHACNLYVTGPLDGLSIHVKVAAYGGLLLASPVVLWELWRFVAPGLRPGERRGAVSFVGDVGAPVRRRRRRRLRLVRSRRCGSSTRSAAPRCTSSTARRATSAC